MQHKMIIIALAVCAVVLTAGFSFWTTIVSGPQHEGSVQGVATNLSAQDQLINEIRERVFKDVAP